MQSRPTFAPFEVEEKLLRDSPLEEALQYGEHQQTGVHSKVSNIVNPNEAPLHLHISPLSSYVAVWFWCNDALILDRRYFSKTCKSRVEVGQSTKIVLVSIWPNSGVRWNGHKALAVFLFQ